MNNELRIMNYELRILSRIKLNEGQSLLEVVIALAIAALIVTGLVKMTATSIKTANFSSEQTEATTIVQKKLSDYVDESHTNPNTFWGRVPSSSQETQEKYCILSDITEGSIPKGRMAVVKVTIFWEQKGDASSCGSVAVGKQNYKNNLEFDTYVTN